MTWLTRLPAWLCAAALGAAPPAADGGPSPAGGWAGARDGGTATSGVPEGFFELPPVRAFLSSDAGPAPEAWTAELEGGRRLLVLVTAPGSLNLYQCGRRRLFVWSRERGALEAAEGERLTRELDRAMGIVSLACASRIAAAGPAVRVYGTTGGRHPVEVTVELRPRGQGGWTVRALGANEPPP